MRPSDSGFARMKFNRRFVKSLYLAAGFIFLALAFIGALLPVMPSAIFVILAAACFARSSPRFETWLLNHAQFGPSLRAWREYGAILPQAKAMAVGGMIVGFTMFWFAVQPGPLLVTGVAAFFIGSAAFVLTRPSGPGQS